MAQLATARPPAGTILYSTAEIADHLHLSTISVHRMKHHGCPYYRVGRLVRYDLHEVLTWLREQA